MEDSELTRRAIKELMKEMDEYKDKESVPTERKKNPLGKPNKLFLGRTINSIMKHNKRQSDRNLQRCKRKLKELDAKKEKYKLRKRRKHAKFKNSSEVSESDSSDEEYKTKRSKKLKKRKKNGRKKNYRFHPTSPSSSCSSRKTDSSSSSNTYERSKNKIQKDKIHKEMVEEDYKQEFYNDYNNESTVGYYVDPNMAYVAMAYNQMNHIIHQQQLVQQQMIKKEIDECIEIPSDLSFSCHSSTGSSLNISIHSSSAEEDENGILTFKLSSDDEDKVKSIAPKLCEKSAENNVKLSLDCDEDDKNSVHSHISLGSIDSLNSLLKNPTEIYLISSSDSDIEIVKTTPKGAGNFLEANGNKRDQSFEA